MSTKYFIYARKSSESEDRQMASIDDQLAEMQRLASSLGLVVVDILSESRSAKAPGRPVFADLLKRIKKGEASGILAWKLNRLARNPVDGGQISWLLQQGIIEHIRTYERDYRPSDNVLMMQVEFGMANQFIKDLSLDVRRGKRRKAERGWYPCQRLPIGYRHNTGSFRPGIDEEIVPDPKTFTTVKKLWRLMLSGQYSVTEIRQAGDRLGLRNRQGERLSFNGYDLLFRNKFYCGYFHWPNEHGDRTRFKGKHTRMISERDFDKVQCILETGSISRKRTHYYPYRGLITCGGCGGHITAERAFQVICSSCKHKFSRKNMVACPSCNLPVSEMVNPSTIDKVYYRCTKNHGPCSQGSITSDRVVESVLTELKSLTVGPELIDWALKALRRINGDEMSSGLLTQLRKRETELRTRVSGLIRMRADGEIGGEQFQVMKDEAEQNLSKLAAQLRVEEDSSKNWLTIAEDGLAFLDKALIKFKRTRDEDRHMIVAKLASNLTLKDKTLYVSTRKVFRRIKDLSDSFTAHFKSFEPENILDTSGPNRRFDPLISLLCEELNSIRTAAIEEIVDQTSSNAEHVPHDHILS